MVRTLAKTLCFTQLFLFLWPSSVFSSFYFSWLQSLFPSFSTLWLLCQCQAEKDVFPFPMHNTAIWFRHVWREWVTMLRVLSLFYFYNLLKCYKFHVETLTVTKRTNLLYMVRRCNCCDNDYYVCGHVICRCWESVMWSLDDTYSVVTIFFICSFMFNMFFCFSFLSWGHGMQSAPRMPLIDTYCMLPETQIFCHQFRRLQCVVALWFSIE